MISLFIVLFCAMVGFYVFAIMPLEKQIDSYQAELKNEQRMAKLLQEKENQKLNMTKEDTTFLQQQLPVEPLVSQFLLNIEKAEVVSNSLITSMQFGDKATNAEVSDPLHQAIQSQSDNVEREEAETTLPSGIKKITAHITVESTNFEDLERFIETLEKLRRITIVEKMSFTGRQEIPAMQEEAEKLTYDLDVSTFYFPGLTDLIEHDPHLDIPDPSHKSNPLVP